MFVYYSVMLGAVIGAVALMAYYAGKSTMPVEQGITKALRSPRLQRLRDAGVMREARLAARANNRRLRASRAEVAAPDRSELIATLRNLGYRTGDARSIADSVPNTITKTEGALAWVLSNVRRG